MRRWGQLGRRGKVLLVLAVVGVLWLAAFTRLLVFPFVDHPKSADAIVVLGPPGTQRLNKALELVNAGVSSNLVISINSYKQRPAQRICDRPPEKVTVVCFTPDPATTLGEGRQIQRLISAHHWHSLVVVTSPYHVSRARWVLDRCDQARLSMVSSDEDVPLSQWAYQYLYQTAGFVKAFFHADC